ncbi:hypothetical protein [Burkholderia pyrrocinia]|uniref:LexA family protein n=1 Tax=Burkholderia pyrrocinia TaxID=60550 RepID=UPI00104957A9|nr:hypothetical protein EVG18_29785 [Burkholderia pyrrocinia]
MEHVCSLCRHLLMNKATDRRSQVLKFIESQVEANGRSPTLDEIAAACGLASRSAAQKHVRALQANGDLEVTPGMARGARPKRGKPAATEGTQLFEVSARDIADLSDTDLRALVARLCMARLADAGLPTAPVIWGGDQRAPDGGIDVRVQMSEQDRRRTHFPRGSIGFQVKATKMGVSEIQREMCPGGLLRPSIRDLIQDRGAYIIASSDSAADAEYKKRVAAMRMAAASDADYEHAEFDYYDARRLADWANRHPGVVAWIRSRLGRPLQGWQPHGQWANTREGKAHAFLPDDKNRLSDPLDRERAFPLIEGLIHVRKILSSGGSAVRLTGLSGVGKTRFAQALFEQSAAPEPLAPELAVYADTSHSPDPSPLAVLEQLLASHRRAVLIIDNCGSQLHNQLTARCKGSDRVSLLTIEYDIREDLPLETNVFQLEAASPELINKVIEQQFPHISEVNARTITAFADGNSRVAIALANTMDCNDSLAGLTDRELFNRLFWLGKEVQHELKIAAEACALVYSFDGEDLEGELAQLAVLTGEPVLALYRHVSELQTRGLAQRRGRWRAVLPHAIANTLAQQALEAIPYEFINQKLVLGQERLLRSFSRRLGYLHRSVKAVTIVREWLSPSGLLGDLASLSPLYIDVLANVAPVDPAATLEAIKRGVDGPRSAEVLAPSNISRARIVRLVRSIAYEKEFFDDCLSVLLAFAYAEPEDNKIDATRPLISSLFGVYLSGTHATTQQRVDWIRRAIKSDDIRTQAIGFDALATALKCDFFSSFYDFEFGARVRDYGAHPHGDALREWFETFIKLVAEFAGQGDLLAERARNLLAQNFRSLWTFAGMADALEDATVPLLDSGWERGWLAIRQTIRFDGDSLSADMLARLSQLEERARPKTLVGRVKAVVLNGHSADVDFADGESDSNGYDVAEQTARELGELVAVDDVAFATLLPLVVTNKQGRQAMFGAGLAIKTNSLRGCWAGLVEAFESTPADQRNVQVLRGFLQTVFERDRAVFEQILDEAIERASLAQWVPVLLLSGPLDDRGCLRLLASMDNPAVPAWVFSYLSFGRATEPIESDRLAQLLQRLSIKPDGVGVAIDILYMYIHGNSNPLGGRLTDVARNLIANAPFDKNNHRLDHELARLIEKFLVGTDAESVARKVLTELAEALEKFTVSRHDLPETLAALFKVQPRIALDSMVGDGPDADDAYFRRRALAGGRRSSALASIPIEALLKWCREGPSDRWRHVAPLVPAFESSEEQGVPRWSKQVLALLEQSPLPIQVAESVADLIIPTSWSGSRAEIIRRRLPLLDHLAEVLGTDHIDEIARWRRNMMQIIEREAHRELIEYQARDERFE